MVDASRQVPSPSAAAWLIDLANTGGPAFLVVRLTDAEAREALILHLLDIGAVAEEAEAKRLVAEAPANPVGVVW